MFLRNSPPSLLSATPSDLAALRGASLLANVREQFAEFLDHGSLAHLSILCPPTCVGLRYGLSAAP